MAVCAPGRSVKAESSKVKYSKLSLLRPARGCSKEGSAKAELFRKESTPSASVGLKGGEVKVVVGAVSADVGEDDCCSVGVDLRPVKRSQKDIATD